MAPTFILPHIKIMYCVNTSKVACFTQLQKKLYCQSIMPIKAQQWYAVHEGDATMLL